MPFERSFVLPDNEIATLLMIEEIALAAQNAPGDTGELAATSALASIIFLNRME